MAYQYAKDHTTLSKETGGFDPFKALLYKLIDRQPKKPRKLPALNHWRKTQREQIEALLNAEVAEAKKRGHPIPKSHYATRREQIARNLYEKLPKNVRDEWEDTAAHYLEVELAKYEHELDLPISTAPADRQCAIQALPKFIERILNDICEATGWKASLIIGGPEPALGGRFNVLNINSGTTKGDVPMNFGTAQRAAYKKDILPLFVWFLKQCFSPEECRACALDPEEGFFPLSTLQEEDEHAKRVLVDEVDDTPLSKFPTEKEKKADNGDGTYTVDVSMDKLDIAEPQVDENPGDLVSDEQSEANVDLDNPFPFKVSLSTTSFPPSSPAPSPLLTPCASPTTAPALNDKLIDDDLQLSAPSNPAHMSHSAAPTASDRPLSLTEPSLSKMPISTNPTAPANPTSPTAQQATSTTTITSHPPLTLVEKSKNRKHPATSTNPTTLADRTAPTDPTTLANPTAPANSTAPATPLMPTLHSPLTPVENPNNRKRTASAKSSGSTAKKQRTEKHPATANIGDGQSYAKKQPVTTSTTHATTTTTPTPPAQVLPSDNPTNNPIAQPRQYNPGDFSKNNVLEVGVKRNRKKSARVLELEDAMQEKHPKKRSKH